jgi:ribA/ribD-fused uncharacterized protein
MMDSTWPLHPMPVTAPSLAVAMRGGARPTFLMYPDWGGAPPLGWLAPWTPTPFVTEVGRFGSAEHHFMHGKALLFGDDASAGKILRTPSPGQARELGRCVRGFREDVWIAERRRLMDEANLAKFRVLPALGDYLRSTWPAVLVQASALDTVWGSGLDLEDPFLRSPWQWPGQNLVGFSLMKVREALRASAALCGS